MLNRWEQSQSSTTGNSSPFDLWMLMICTAEADEAIAGWLNQNPGGLLSQETQEIQTEVDNLLRLYNDHIKIWSCISSRDYEGLSDVVSHHIYDGFNASTEIISRHPDYFCPFH